MYFKSILTLKSWVRTLWSLILGFPRVNTTAAIYLKDADHKSTILGVQWKLQRWEFPMIGTINEVQQVFFGFLKIRKKKSKLVFVLVVG